VLDSGESQKEAIRPDFNPTIMIDFHGATITSDVGLLLMREIDDRFKIIAPMGDCLEDLRCPKHTRHSLMVGYGQNLGKGDVPSKFVLSCLCKKNWLREENPLGDCTRAKRLPKLFWDTGKPRLPHNLS
jgi:hypothetical protein